MRCSRKAAFNKKAEASASAFFVEKRNLCHKNNQKILRKKPVIYKWFILIKKAVFAIIFVGYETKKEMTETEKEQKKSIFRHLGKNFEGYKKYTVLTMVFGCQDFRM